MQIEPSLVHSDRRTCWLIGFSLLEPAHARCHQPGGVNVDGLPPQNAAHVAFPSPLLLVTFLLLLGLYYRFICVIYRNYLSMYLLT